jgi:SAM-dependent methyltransferase
MYAETRRADETVASTPQLWAETFRRSVGFSTRTQIAFSLDPRWRLIRRYLPHGGRVLDAGSGLGEWVEFLSKRGYRAEGFDYSAELIQRVKRLHPRRRWCLGVTQALPYVDTSFDAVISWGVIEHDPHGPLQQLREFRRILRVGGRAIVTVPYDSPAMRRSSSLSFPDGEKFFQFFFTPDELAAAIQEAGLRVLERAPVPQASEALVAPGLYARSQGSHPALFALRLLYRFAPFLPGPRNMVYAVCERP